MPTGSVDMSRITGLGQLDRHVPGIPLPGDPAEVEAVDRPHLGERGGPGGLMAVDADTAYHRRLRLLPGGRLLGSVSGVLVLLRVRLFERGTHPGDDLPL
nr:hypothetical protein GCM10020092_094670 [Actinoplanes digitatis]